MPAGRPAAFDEAEQKSFCSLIALGYPLDDAARSVGYSGLTARRAMRRNPEFMKQYRDAHVGVCTNSLLTLRNAASTDWRAAKWYIERLMPVPFANKTTELTMEAADTMFDEALYEIRSVLPKGKRRRRGMRRLMKLASSWHKHLKPDGNLAKETRITPREKRRIERRYAFGLPERPASTDPQATLPSPAQTTQPPLVAPPEESFPNSAQIDLNTT